MSILHLAGNFRLPGSYYQKNPSPYQTTVHGKHGATFISVTLKTMFMALSRYEIFKDSKGKFRFRLLAPNGETILQSSTGYNQKPDCQLAIASSRESAPLELYYKKGSSATSYWFILKAKNGYDLGFSVIYTSPLSRDEGMAVVKRCGPTRRIEERL